MLAAITKIFKADGKELVVQAVNIQGKATPRIPAGFGKVFREIAPLLKKKRQAVYICDDLDYGITREHPSAYAVTTQRILIYPRRWPVGAK